MEETILQLECKKAELEVLHLVLEVAATRYNEILDFYLLQQKKDPEAYPEGFPELLAGRDSFYYIVKAIRNQLEVEDLMLQAKNATRH